MPKGLLTSEEISARIKAARLLRGITQPELARRLNEAGLTWRLAGELERGEQTMLALHRMALAEALGVPERWFTVPLEDLCPEAPPDDELRMAVMERFNALAERFERSLDRLDRKRLPVEGDVREP
jgi:transcriptional regulator with XRE-family HTH domain